MTYSLRSLTLASALLFGCTVSPNAPSAPPTGGGWRGTRFVADVDPAAGKFEIRPLVGTTARGGAAAIEPATVVQDGTPFEGPPESLELYTESSVIDLDGSACGFPSSFCAVVNVGNFYTGRLDAVVAQIESISPAAGHNGLNSDPSVFGLDATLGLFNYGAIELGSIGQKTWVFGDDGTAYRVVGTVWADLPAPIAPSFGYTGGATPFSYDDISGTGAVLALGDDEISAAIPLGFAFDFFGVATTELRVSSNGLLVLNPAETDPGCCSGQLIPSAAGPNGIIAGYWEDLAAPAGGLRTQTLGVAPNRRFVAQWTSVAHFGGGAPVSFQIVLFEGSNNVEIRHLNAASDGGEHSVGIERADGFDGLSLALGDLSFVSSAFQIVHP